MIIFDLDTDMSARGIEIKNTINVKTLSRDLHNYYTNQMAQNCSQL